MKKVTLVLVLVAVVAVGFATGIDSTPQVEMVNEITSLRGEVATISSLSPMEIKSAIYSFTPNN